jgi:hypothetical protein
MYQINKNIKIYIKKRKEKKRKKEKKKKSTARTPRWFPWDLRSCWAKNKINK